MPCWHPYVEECGGYLICADCGMHLDHTHAYIEEQDGIVERILKKSDSMTDCTGDYLNLTKTVIRQILTIADVATPGQTEVLQEKLKVTQQALDAALQSERTAKADLIEAYKAMDRVTKHLKPNLSNDMPWEDEIIICHENLQQEADALRTELNDRGVVVRFLQKENQELFSRLCVEKAP